MENPKYLQIKPEDLKKIELRKQADERLKVDPEWLLIAEFGKHYGYAAVQDVLDNKITGETMTALVTAARKLESNMMKRISEAVFVASVSSQTKNPVQTYSKLVKKIYAEGNN